MPKKLAIINTNPLTYDMLNELFKNELPDVEVFNILDDSLLPQARAEGITDTIMEKMKMYVKCAQISGADLILNQCSSVSDVVDAVRNDLDIPYLKIDEAMAEKAVKIGGNITVLATVSSTLEPSRKLIENTAEKLNASVNIKTVLVEGAIDLLGTPEGEKEHNRLILEEITKQSAESDVIVLAQASMYRIMKYVIDPAVPVLSSPSTAVEKIREILK